jgi:hypothetical protein
MVNEPLPPMAIGAALYPRKAQNTIVAINIRASVNSQMSVARGVRSNFR